MTDYVLERGKYFGPALNDLGRAAVIIVDMTNDFAHPDGVYPRHGATCETFPAIVPPVRRLLETAGRVGIPTVATNQVVYADWNGKAIGAGGLLEGRPWLTDEGLRPGTWGTRVIDELPQPDFCIDKPRASAFFGTPVDLILRGFGIETVIIVGCYTNQCVESTARDAWARDYRVVVASDGVTAFDQELHEATLQSLKPLSTQLTCEEIVRMMAAHDLSTGQQQYEEQVDPQDWRARSGS